MEGETYFKTDFCPFSLDCWRMDRGTTGNPPKCWEEMKQNNLPCFNMQNIVN